MDGYDSEASLILQHFSRSTRFTVIYLLFHFLYYIFYFSYVFHIFFQSFSIHMDASRSRQELSNEYLVAKIGVDTAENEPSKV